LGGKAARRVAKLLAMDHSGRVKRLRQVLAPRHLDALLITHLPNLRYLCGFSGSAGALLVTPHQSVFFTDGRYTAQARAEVRGSRVVIARKPPLVAASEWIAKSCKPSGNRCYLGIEGEHLTVAGRSGLAALLGADFRLRETSALVEQARMVKDAEEIERLRAAVQLGASLFEVALKTIRAGVTETEVAAEMEYAARRGGAQEMSFSTIIAAGKRSALPHGRAMDAVIPASGFVVCDFGVILADYCSDMTRTVHVGRPTSEACRVYEAVREAQAAAAEVIRPGVSAEQVDSTARKLLQKKGLGRFFTHSTGHGVGLEIHESPRLAAGQREPLRPGMVITIEPGVYIPGKWGVRIEDMVVVTERGCEVLTPTGKQLIVV
jgi:Xaa-Pro aminopeptidase